MCLTVKLGCQFLIHRVDMDPEDCSFTYVLSITIIVLCGLYLLYLAFPTNPPPLQINGMVEEGFTNPSNTVNGVDQRIDDQCYDEFYAKVYDPLVQPIARAPLETKVALEWMTQQGRAINQLRVADIGCGTGLHVELFAKQGVFSVVGFDKSAAMIAEGKKRFPDRDLQVGDATVATMASANQFDLITLLYFTVYMVPDRIQMLKNIYLWLDTGGVFMVHIVNKHKMDPILESASPWIAFSPQKYMKEGERITKSEVFFDKFDYMGDFQLHGSRAMYEETFKFKDGTIRKHEQRLWMPDIKTLVEEITSVGFKLQTHQDLTAGGLEYMYLFIFQK